MGVLYRIGNNCERLKCLRILKVFVMMFKSMKIVAVGLLCSVPCAGFAVEFGDNSSEYAHDGVCDDRRFMGIGAARNLHDKDNFKDATDCRKLFDLGLVQVASESAGRAATNCAAIDFGNNSSEWSKDGECDDPRFDGPGSNGAANWEDLLGDATDCKRRCVQGKIWLRTPAN